MKTQEFIDTLRNAGEKELIIEHKANYFLPKAFHITEVKNVHIESVDCGGRPDTYDQTIIQLWWDGREQKDRAMSAAKFMAIIDKVDKVKPLKRDTDLFLEWGHAELLPSNYKVQKVEVKEDSIKLNLFAPPTECKPISNLAILGGSCSPGSGCC